MKKLIVFMFSVVLMGSCQRDVEGCTDVNATNFNSDATVCRNYHQEIHS